MVQLVEQLTLVFAQVVIPGLWDEALCSVQNLVEFLSPSLSALPLNTGMLSLSLNKSLKKKKVEGQLGGSVS